MADSTPTASSILKQAEKLIAAGGNEADTRLKIITDVLYHVLGWTHTDVHAEERVSEDGNTTWADYTIRTGTTAIVVEAKRVGVTFDEIPDTRRTNLRGKIISGSTGDAIIQARDYARKTTFLHHTRKVSAATLFEPRNDKPYPHWFHIDFRNYSSEESPLKFLTEEIKKGVNEDGFLSDYERCIKHAYKDDIDALLRGPMYLLSNDEHERKSKISASHCE